MSLISKPVVWKSFDISQVQPVQYYSILKRKRSFLSQVIRNYDQVFKYGYLHYCSLVPKNTNLSSDYRYEMCVFIVFFNEIPSNSFIGFRVKANKETFIHERNLLIFFLKKSKAEFYCMDNNYIYVQCKTNAWQVFYHLYGDYLTRYALTIIGTLFFNHFVYSSCIKREVQLMELLYKGSKIIRIGKYSVYYKMHRKRKISVTDLIYMTINMPKSKRYIASFPPSKESFLCSDFKNTDLYTRTGNKIHVSKLVPKKFKMPFENILCGNAAKKSVPIQEVPAFPDSFYPLSESTASKFKVCKSERQSYFINTSKKRKFIEVESNIHELEAGPSTLKCFKTSKSSYANEDEWKQYQNLKPCVVKSYSDIPSIRHIVPNLLKNGNSSDFVNSNFNLMNTGWNVSRLPLEKLSDKVSSMPTIPGISRKEIAHVNSYTKTKTSDIKTTRFVNENALPFTFKEHFDVKTDVVCVTPKTFSSDGQSPDVNCEQHINSANKVSISPLKTTENIVEDFGFTTAAGKTINVSDKALLTANKLIQNTINDTSKEVVHERVSCDISKTHRKTSYIENYQDFQTTSMTNIPFAKFSKNKPSHGIKIKEDETLSKYSSPNLFDKSEDASFSTAAGKSIQISNNAMQIASRLIENVFDDGNKSSSSKSINIDKNNFKGNTSRNANVCFEGWEDDEKLRKGNVAPLIDMDESLVEKFFDDALFDYKDLESGDEYNKDGTSGLSSVPKSDKNLPSLKSRKSLGGRRSMKYFSNKL